MRKKLLFVFLMAAVSAVVVIVLGKAEDFVSFVETLCVTLWKWGSSLWR